MWKLLSRVRLLLQHTWLSFVSFVSYILSEDLFQKELLDSGCLELFSTSILVLMIRTLHGLTRSCIVRDGSSNTPRVYAENEALVGGVVKFSVQLLRCLLNFETNVSALKVLLSSCLFIWFWSQVLTIRFPWWQLSCINWVRCWRSSITFDRPKRAMHMV